MRELKVLNKKELCLSYLKKNLPCAIIKTRQTKNGLFIYNKSDRIMEFSDLEVYTYISNKEFNIFGITSLLNTFIETSKYYNKGAK
jgi:hypothetical protein